MERDQRPILLALTTSMGWRTYGERLYQQARANPQDNIVFHPFKPSSLGRRISWQPLYADRIVSSLGVLDPFTIAEWQVAATPVLRKRYAAAIVATQNLAAGLMRQHPGMPIFILLDVTRELYRHDFGSWFITNKDVKREGEILARAAHIFALTDWAARSVIRTANVESSRLSIVPPVSFKCRGLPIRRPLLHNGRLQLLFAGLDFERKGGPRLLRWQRECWSVFADLHIVTRLEHTDRSCPNTIWYGPVDNDRMIHQIMPRMDFLVHPAVRECSGLVVTEAAGNGVPALVSAVNGLQELVQHGITGLVARDDAEFRALIPELYRNRARVAQMSLSAKMAADERYSADQVYSTIMNIVRAHLRVPS